MKDALIGLQNFLYLIEQNWTLIIIVIGLIISIVKKVKKYLELSEEQKIKLAQDSLKHIMVGLCMEAELDWSEYQKAGSVKRAEVIDQIFDRYPILLRVTDQESLIKSIDTMIDDALVEVRKLVES